LLEPLFVDKALHYFEYQSKAFFWHFAELKVQFFVWLKELLDYQALLFFLLAVFFALQS
jgi:hypothetical protein